MRFGQCYITNILKRVKVVWCVVVRNLNNVDMMNGPQMSMRCGMSCGAETKHAPVVCHRPRCRTIVLRATDMAELGSRVP